MKQAATLKQRGTASSPLPLSASSSDKDDYEHKDHTSSWLSGRRRLKLVFRADWIRSRLRRSLDIYHWAFSERTRRLIWFCVLVSIFFMERRRTHMREKKDLAPAVVISGIIIETPDDTIPSAHDTGFVPVSTGSLTFVGTDRCNYFREDPGNKCWLHYPFVDLSEFTANNNNNNQANLRLKQVLAMPNNKSDFALLTQRGIGTNHQDGNQDRSFMIKPYYPFPVREAKKDFVLCLMDGHGSQGHLLAEATMRDFPVVLTEELQRPLAHELSDERELHRWVTTIFVRSFQKVDKHIPDAAVSGSTLTVALRLGHYLHVANVGDSRAFVVAYHPRDMSTKIVFATKQDTPADPEERQRILDMGGSLWLPPVTPRGVQPPPRVFFDVWDEVNNQTTNLAVSVSRSIGDRRAAKFGVISEPRIASIRIDSVKKEDPHAGVFVFLASDGILEKMASQTLAERLAASLYRKDTVTPLETVEGIFLDINDIWRKSRTVEENGQLNNYRDDMTLAVVKVEP